MYKLVNKYMTNESVAVNFTDENGRVHSIPFALDNTDYQQYLKFLEEGGQPLPADEGTQ